MPFDLVINNGIIVTMEPDCQPFIGSMGITDGKIEAIQEGAMDRSEGKEFVDASGKIVFPGLINGHCHGDMTVVRGLADDLTLLEQNEKFAPYHFLYDLLTEKDRYYSRQLTYIEALRSGTTFIMENMYWSLGLKSISAMSETGIRGALAEDVRHDFTDPSNLISLDFIKDFKRECEKSDLLPVLGSVSEEDFDSGLLKNIFALADESGLFVTQHLAETTWRHDLCREKFNESPVNLFSELGFLSEKLIGSHSIYIDEAEIKLMAKTQTKVVNTPVCEMKIADGIAPIPEFLKAGVICGLGTDGALWNNSNDMFREVKGLLLLHSVSKGVRQLTARTGLEMATINGAKVFQIDNRKGSLAVGKDADFLLIDTHEPHMRPLRVGNHENVLSLLAYNVTGNDVQSVYIEGEPVVVNRQVVTIDEEQIINEVQAASERVTNALPVDW